ncbi:nuclear transport factor 2 family protein [Neobacillus vireti]|uniref:nuclear transport factor 2 family protein n=1 Tax=Neobacillus vireti TaxID=220686 RepID=UPI002FFE84FB
MSIIQVSLEEKIERLEAIEEIRKLIANYCHGVDKKEYDLFLNIWHKDAVFDVPHIRVGSGIEEITDMLETIKSNSKESYHHISNSVIEVNGNTASGIHDVLFGRLLANDTYSLLSGTYRDEYVKENGRWYVKKRAFTPHPIKSPIFD